MVILIQIIVSIRRYTSVRKKKINKKRRRIKETTKVSVKTTFQQAQTFKTFGYKTLFPHKKY